MRELISTDLADKVFDRLDGVVPVLPLGRDSIDIDLHAIVKATLDELAEAGFLTLEAAPDV
jgi:hypothetical protein